VVVKIDKVRTPAMTFKLCLVHKTLSIYGDLIFLNKNWSFHVYGSYRADTTTTISLKGTTSYIYDNFICEIKNIILSCIFVSEQTRPSLSIFILTSKLTKFEPHSDFDLSHGNPSLFRDEPYIYGKFICERKITILLWIPNVQSGHNHHLLYFYNIRNDKVWTLTVTFT
jgi:hypothetical protein